VTVDAYLAGLAPAGAEAVAEVRRRVHALRDDVTEVIRYDMPTFQVDGTSRLHVAAWARHVSIYPEPSDPALADRLAAYSSGKGTLKFPLDRPLPWELVDDVLRALLR
jgi:uncharacterized protein YdhG (YjbR/CyaY superfamily)